MTQKERARQIQAKANALRAEHKRACKCLAVSVVVLGGFIGIVIGDHYAGLMVEAIGLYLVELV